MIHTHRTLLLSGLVFTMLTISFTCNSQSLTQVNSGDTATTPYWIDMMQDQSISIPAVQRAFEIYWKDRPITKSCGWKPFKRWEYNAVRRMKSNGEREAADRNLKAYNEYKTKHLIGKEVHGNWIEMGPANLPTGSNGLGRVNAIGFHPTNPQIIYIGAPAGGLWKTTDGGNSWEMDFHGIRFYSLCFFSSLFIQTYSLNRDCMKNF